MNEDSRSLRISPFGYLPPTFSPDTVPALGKLLVKENGWKIPPRRMPNIGLIIQGAGRGRSPGPAPWTVANLRAFVQARELSEQNPRVLHESSPLVLADLEDQTALMGTDFSPYGNPENRVMVAAFCEEQFAQGLIAVPLNSDALFADFGRLSG